MPPQTVPSHWHWPLTQLAPGRQALVQAPQFETSWLTSRHWPLHTTFPAGQPQVPLLHIPLQQSVSLTQVPPGTAQAHLPSWQFPEQHPAELEQSQLRLLQLHTPEAQPCSPQQSVSEVHAAPRAAHAHTPLSQLPVQQLAWD
jgi:hypothetical protein